MRTSIRAILLASAALLVGAGSAAALILEVPDVNGHGADRVRFGSADKGPDLSSIRSASFRDQDLEEHGFKKDGVGKGRGGKDFARKGKHGRKDKDFDFDHDDFDDDDFDGHFKKHKKKKKKDDDVVVPEPSVGLLLAAPLATLILRGRKRQR